MASQQLGTREQWAVAYAELRAEEKDLTRRNAALARKRQALPWVPVEKDYRFETNDGTKTLAELFDGRSQLIVRHFMHGPKTPEGCPGCTFETDNLAGAVVHLAHRTTPTRPTTAARRLSTRPGSCSTACRGAGVRTSTAGRASAMSM
jgi:predicted dithiol-disulfide oxidoreductase (DUF899 family)